MIVAWDIGYIVNASLYNQWTRWSKYVANPTRPYQRSRIEDFVWMVFTVYGNTVLLYEQKAIVKCIPYLQLLKYSGILSNCGVNE